MIPSLFVAFFATLAGLYLIDTGLHKSDTWYKLRWCAASIPVFLIAGTFAWNGLFQPMTSVEFEKYQCLYWSIGGLMVYATCVWAADIIDRWSRHRGR